jgi:hypothetical protein
MQIIAPVTLISVVIVAVASGATTVVAVAAPEALRNSIILMKLLDDPTIIGIVGVALVEDAVMTSSALIVLRAISVALLLLGLRCEDDSLLVVGVLRLGLRQRRLQQIVHEEPLLLGLGAPVSDLEEPDHGSQLVIHGQLLLHLDVGDARGEHRDDLLVGDPRDLVPHLAEALDVLSKIRSLVLTHCLEFVFCGGALVRGHEVGDELSAQILP